MTWLAIALGGALGAMARHGINSLVHGSLLSLRFPVGILVVNVCGCFLIGMLAGLIAGERLALSIHWREFIIVGLLGGFTTFSTFGLDTFTLARAHESGWAYAALNVAAQMIGGLAAVWIGYSMGLSKP